jgi:hypothetical protein
VLPVQLADSGNFYIPFFLNFINAEEGHRYVKYWNFEQIMLAHFGGSIIVIEAIECLRFQLLHFASQIDLFVMDSRRLDNRTMSEIQQVSRV